MQSCTRTAPRPYRTAQLFSTPRLLKLHGTASEVATYRDSEVLDNVIAAAGVQISTDNKL